MIPLPNILGISAVVAILSAAGGYTYGYSKASDKAAVAAVELEKKVSEKILESHNANEKLKIELDNRHEESKNIISALIDQPVPRVFVPIAKCPTGKPDTSKGSDPAAIAARALSEEAGRILSEGRQRVKGIVAEAELELASCNVVKQWALRIGLKPAQ